MEGKDDGQEVVVAEMLVTHKKNYKTVSLYSTKDVAPPSPLREDLPLPHARCFLLRNLFSENECQVSQPQAKSLAIDIDRSSGSITFKNQSELDTLI